MKYQLTMETFQLGYGWEKIKGGDLSYSCVANNTVGTTEKTVNFTVKGTAWEVHVVFICYSH